MNKSYEDKILPEYYWAKNMYVLYALSKLGLQVEIEDSYQICKTRVMAIKDSYNLALMANSAHYLGKTEDEKLFLEILSRQYLDSKIDIKTTMTGSGKFSAKSETISLYLMALQNDTIANQIQITNVAADLLSRDGRYGFGSTQATGLALETLSKYFAKNEKLYGVNKPVIKINGATTSQNVSIGSAFKNGENTINVNYPSDIGLPYKLQYGYYTLQAPKSSETPVVMETKFRSLHAKVGETNRMTITIKNKLKGQLPMVTAKIGIPAGLTLQNSLLKDLIDKKQVSYYEIFDNYLVLYWEYFGANETKTINLDLKVEFAGEYTGKASNVYLYYTPEFKFWNEGLKSVIEP